MPGPVDTSAPSAVRAQAQAPSATHRGGRTDLAAAARKFEALVLQEMLRSASRPLLPGGSPLDGGSAARMYRELFYGQVARLAARRGDLGIAGAIERRGGR